MKDNSHCFKVGDVVTPNPITVYGCSLANHIGENFTVVRVDEYGVTVDRGTAIQTASGWVSDVWMLSKNHIVHQILKDL